jgi:hypothetical protein
MKMKRIVISLSTLIIASAFFTGCTKETLKGEGNIITESRELSDFTMVEISGERYAEIIPANKQRVELTGYENLVAAYEAKVINGKLSFEYPDHCNVLRDNIKMKIYTSSIHKIAMSGHTEVKVADGFSGQQFDAQLSGNSHLTIGTGNFETSGFFTSGNAKVYASNLASNKAQVDVSGNGYIEVKAKDQLSIRISGNGEVHYWGNPAVSSSISGNGKTVKH